MRLTREQYYKLKEKLTRLCGIHQPIFYENGTFEIYNIPENDLYNFKRKLEQADFIDQVNVYKGRADFGHMNFNRGFAEPTSFWNIRGFVKADSLKEDLERVKAILADQIRGEWEAIDNYNDAIADLDAEGGDLEAAKAILKDIAEEEQVHVGELEQCLSEIEPDLKNNVESGKEEAEEKISEPATTDLNKEESLNEKVELHKELNPKIWDDEQKLKPEIRSKILQIVSKFKQYLANDGVELIVKDVYLLGSNANYNYNDDSDLDIHIIADESIDCVKKHLPIIYNAYKSLFNSKYEITIKGINVELYVENEAQMTNVSAGIYSLAKGWIRKPDQYKMPDIDQEAVTKGVDGWEKRYFQLTEDGTVDQINNYIDEIYELRQDSIQKEGEFGLGNLIFKEVRRLGYLSDLKELKDKLVSQELSLENLKQD